MVEKFYTLMNDKKRIRSAFLIVFGELLLVHLFIFRTVVIHSSAVMHNNASIVREELVPFFNFHSQYLPAESSKLTGSDEFRVTYSFWSSWTRYNPILPFMLVIVNTISAFIAFYAVFRLVRRFAPGRQAMAIFVSFLGALFVHFVLLYSKIAHFYSLILGFSLFALAMSLVIEQFFFEQKLGWKNIAAASFLVLINPAVHYHVIFYLALGMLLILQIFVNMGRPWREIWALLKRNVLYCIFVGLLSAIPYLLYIKLTTPTTTDVFNQIPVNYWMIYYSSVPLQYLFSLDSLGHVDLFRYGNYLAPEPRLMTLAAMVVATSIFISGAWVKLSAKKRAPLLVLLAMVAISLWMSIGYSNDSVFSFHQSLGAIDSLLVNSSSTVAGEIIKLIGVFINVLRFPHRFEFIVFYGAAVLLAIGLMWLCDYLRAHGFKRMALLGIATVVTLVPFLASTAYRQTLTSGDFGKFLTPYQIPQDLKDIKQKLAKSQNNRVFILPSMESGRQIPGADTHYTFLDKYLIYYLNQPSLYYGEDANTNNKIVAFMVYRAIGYGQDWWQSILIIDFGITDILVPKNIEGRQKSITYLPGIETSISNSLAHASRFKKVYDGKDYQLYATNERPNKKAVLNDTSWSDMLQQFTTKGFSLNGQQLFYPAQLKDFLAQSSKTVYTDNPERTFYTLYLSQKGKSFTADSSLLPFSNGLVASSSFTADMFSLTTLYGQYNKYNYAHEVVPSMLSLPTSQFVGTGPNNGDKVLVTVKVPASGDYRVLIHAAANSANLTAKNGKNTYTFTRLSADPVPKGFVDFSYYKADIHLTKGAHTFAVNSSVGSNLVEQMGIVPKADIPADFSDVTKGNVQLVPTSTPNVFSADVRNK